MNRKALHVVRGPFTLIELLVVVAIIAILASLLLPALSRARAQAKISTCLNQQKQLAMGLFMYADEYDEWGPGAVHWGSGQMLNLAHRGVWIDDMLPDNMLFACPDTDIKAMRNTAYFPGRRITTRQYMSYLMGFGTSNHNDTYDLYGWHNYWTSLPTNQYRTPCPRLPMAGHINKDPVGGRSFYVGEPEDQGMFVDIYKPAGGTWAGYGLSGILPNHNGMEGGNTTFLDGHGEWRVSSAMKERFRAYSPGYFW